MRANLFWFSDGQWARIEPFIPSNRRGVKPKNNRRILSGIMHVLKSGCRWVDCPPEYGPAKTVYNRFNRWSAQGIWQSIFEAAAEPAELPQRHRALLLQAQGLQAHRNALRQTRSELPLSPVPRCRRGILALVVRGFRFWDNMASVSAPG